MLPHILRALLILTMCSSAWASMHPVACESGTTTSRDYQYNEGNNRLSAFTQTLANAQGQTSTQNTYTLDTQGQLLSDGLRNYGYDAQGRLSDITTTTNTGTTTTRYAHNALGQRIFKTEPQYSTAKAAGVEEGTDTNQETNKDLGLIDTLVHFFTNLWNPIARPAEKQGYAYLYDEEGTLLAEYGSGGVASAGNAKYIYLPTATGPQPVLTIQSDKPYAVHADHLNTPRRLTQADGQVAWQWAYSAFGDEAPTTAANRFTSPSTNPTTGTTAVKQVVFNLRYPGQYADAESNLFYNYFRSYDAKTGRYTQPDPIGLGGGSNRFIYAGGDALNYMDPTGLDRWGSNPLGGQWQRPTGYYAPRAEPADATPLYALSALIPFVGLEIAGLRLAPLLSFLWNVDSVANSESPGVGRFCPPAGKAVAAVTKRPSGFRKQTVQDAWDNASPGARPGTKACPTCTADVNVAPGQGRRDWDVDHQPKWKDRDLTGMDRKQVLDAYNSYVRLRCPTCNRSDN
jgi:RHS repeat-associated protein